jgi:FkbM family methyltransferase
MKLYLRLAAWAARILPQPIKKGLYRFQPLARWLRRSLNQAAPQGQVEISIAAGILTGYKMNLDLQTEKDYWLGTYEPELQKAAQDLVKKGMVIYDVGANIGYISLILAHLCGPAGKVYSFEALPANLLRLQGNIVLNQKESIIQIVPKAVIDASRTVSFLAHSSTSMGKALGSAGRLEEYDQEIKVAGIALDDFVYQGKNPVPDLIKMDIEGGEILAIKGMRQLLKEHKPLFFIELHGEKAAHVIWNVLTEAGYELTEMRKDYPKIQSLSQLGWKAYIIAKY